jgi:alpha-D-xyloside xylohydrolase
MLNRLLATAIWIAVSGCGGAPPPPQIQMQLDDGMVLTIDTDPLRLRVWRGPDAVVDQSAFVEVGVVDKVDPKHYYDPAAPEPQIQFRAAERATAFDAGTHVLTLALDGGGGDARLTVAAGRLVLDTSGVTGAVLARFVLPLDAGEDVYGFGEAFDSPAARGVVREMQLRVDLARASSTNDVHAPVPLALYPARGVAFFADERRPGAFDVGAARANALLATFATATLSLAPIAGAPLDALDRYTALTGRPAAPPDWAFAPMMWRNANVGGDEVIADAQAARANAVPFSTLWVDNPWQTGYDTLTFDPSRFSDPAGMVTELDALGFRFVVWSAPYVDAAPPTDGDHAEAAAGGFLITDATGRAFDWPWSDGPGALVDFTAPGATDWWRQRIARATALGVHGFKLDFAEDLVPELGGNKTTFQTHDGSTDVMHAAYAIGYHAAYLGALPPGDGFLITRAGTYGSQSVSTCIWPGDLDNDFRRHDDTQVGGLPAAIAGGLSLSASGFPFFGSDIGGFREGLPSEEALLRWSEYAALGTIMQLGGGGGQGSSHFPWDTTEWSAAALPIFQRYARLHMDLFPYLYSLAGDAAAHGHPVTRAPGLMFPGHPYEDDFLVGDALFVAPVVEAGATTRTVTLPPGDWIDWWTGARSAGGAAVTVAAPLDTLPLWRRAGELVVLLIAPVDTVLPSSAAGVASLADPALARGVRVLVTPGAAASFDLYDGGHVAASADAGGVTVQAAAGARHQDFRFEVDWRNSPLAATPPSTANLPAAPDRASVDSCAAPGCWFYDAASGTAFVRLVGAGAGASATLL